MFKQHVAFTVLFSVALTTGGCGKRIASSQRGELASKTGCPQYTSGAPVGRITSPRMTETSGVVVSRKDARVLWIHNDSGDLAKIYAIGTDGVPLGSYTLAGADAVDWEDMAADRTHLYIGDIGDNFRIRKSVVVYRVKEPTVSREPPHVEAELTDVDRLELVYPNGPKDSETLLVDPVSGDLFLVTKEQGNNTLYRARAPHSWNRGPVVLEEIPVDLSIKKVADFESYGGEATGGDVSLTGDAIIIRDYWHAYLWKRAPGVTIGQALGTPACEVPVVSPMTDGQGEAIGFDTRGSGYYTIPEAIEGVPQIRIYYFEEKKTR